MGRSITTPELSQLVSTLVSAAGAAPESNSEVARATDVLKQLRKVSVTAQQLKETDAGKKVNKLKKHSCQAIADAAVTVIEAWKNCVKQEPPQAAPFDANAAPSTTTEPSSRSDPKPKNNTKPPAPIKTKTTGDPTRDKIRNIMADALAQAAGSVPEADAATVACIVEEALFKQNAGVSAGYKSKFRAISFNLKDPNNPDLRRKVLSEEIPAEVLIGMTSEQMASDARKEEVEKIRDHAKRECERKNTSIATTDQFQCGKCKQKKTTYFVSACCLLLVL
jgi:transcription elongation factor S-II